MLQPMCSAPKPLISSVRVLPPVRCNLKLKICRLFRANNYVQVRCRNKFIKRGGGGGGGGKRSEFIIIIIYQVRTTANVEIVTIMIAQYTFQ